MPKKRRSLVSVAILATWVCFACPARTQTSGATTLSKADYDRVIADPEDDGAFQQLLDKLPKVTAGDPPGAYYVLEGDLLLTEGQVRDTFRRYSTEARPAAPTGELKVMTQNGKLVYWPAQHRHLTYVVDPVSFTRAERQIVSTNMKLAARSWVAACTTCGLSFTELANANADATFRVVKSNDLGNLVALSFFPNDPADMRVLRIAPVYFQLGPATFSPVGVLRHELGHVLGYRHEHIADVRGCSFEDNNWRPLTPYDNKSVMHYFCGGGGTLGLDLTDIDKAGHKKLYGGHP